MLILGNRHRYKYRLYILGIPIYDDLKTIQKIYYIIVRK